MSAALTYRARVFADANRRSRPLYPLRGLGSITWGTRNLGVMIDPMNDIGGAPLVPMAIPGITAQPFPGNPDTRPGAWPGLDTTNMIRTDPGYVPGFNFNPPPVQASGGPAQVPVVVTPNSGPIPSPGTVAAATAAPVSWLDQSLIVGIANKWLLVGGIGAFLFLGGKKK